MEMAIQVLIAHSGQRLQIDDVSQFVSYVAAVFVIPPPLASVR